jgi:peroxiredoxin
MVMTQSQELSLGTVAPEFSLPDPAGKMHSLDDDSAAKAHVVVFMCNHCPYVRHLRKGLADLGRDCEAWGVTMLGINSNDFEKYPDDRPDQMAVEVETYGYTFPYLIDMTQSVAKAYGAACTPEFYVFDGDKKLVYHGQFDASRPSNDIEVTGADVRGAIEAVLAGEPVPSDQTPSLGCNIKWRPGNEPEWVG